MNRKFLGLLLSVVMLLSLGVSAAAEDEINYENKSIPLGDSEYVDVVYPEENAQFENGSGPIKIVQSDPKIIDVVFDKATPDPGCVYVSYALTAEKTGTATIQFVDTKTDKVLNAYKVTVPDEGVEKACKGGKKTYVISHQSNGAAVSSDKSIQSAITSNKTSSIVIGNYARYAGETTFEITFPETGIYHLTFTDAYGRTVQSATVLVDEHQFGKEPTSVEEATCKAPKTLTYTCTVCGETKKETVGEIGSHKYDEPEYTWTKTDGGYKVEAVWKCEVCEKVEKQETDVKDSSAVKKDDITTYTAKFKFGDKEYTATKEISDKNKINVVPNEDGFVTLGVEQAKAGENVTFTVTAREGNKIAGVSVKDADNKDIKLDKKDNTYSFVMPATEATITVEYAIDTGDKDKEEPAVKKFVDVNYSAWYGDAVTYVSSKGYMDGVGDNKFEPNGLVTRAQIAQILYAAENKPAVTGGSRFTDVKDNQWFAKAVTWAAEKGVVAGYGNGKFGPNDPITREQMVAILYKYSQLKGYDLSATADLSTFKDQNQISKYAVTSMKWAVGAKLVSGRGNNMLAPKGTATRAEIATILRAYDTNIRK